jgi:aconitate decarboxylase
MSTNTAGDPAVEKITSGLRTFTDWAAGVELADLPDDVVTRLCQSVRDGLGCAIFGASLPWAQIVADTVAAQSGSTGPARVWRTGATVDTVAAAVANGTALQSYELDDLHAEASVHGSSAMLPATLALAELREGVSGADLLAALAVGWEAAVRVNRCMGHILVHGWHPPTIMGTIAATIACGRLLRLPPEQLHHCVSLGILQASGLTSVQYGGMAKRFYAGKAAGTGVQSALLAERGFTAPDDAFGHPVGGFLSSFAPGREYDVDALTRGLGTDWAGSGISFKLYSCCGAAHPAIDLVADIVAEHPETTADSVARIELEMTEHGYAHVGFRYVPDNVVTAQFSIEYCVAAYLLEGAVFVEQFRDELLDDPRIMSLVTKTESSCDPSLEDKSDLRAKRHVRVRITLEDGQVFEKQGMLARGHADKPAPEADLRGKFDRLVAGAVDPATADALSDLSTGLADVADVRELVTRLTSAASA